MVDEKIYKELIICLFDGEYHFGVAALLNSIVESKYSGLIIIAYRGELPPWVNQLESKSDGHYNLTKDIEVYFKKVSTEMNLGFYKPYILKEALDTYPATQKFYYFDADILVKAPWSMYSAWLENGICLCHDNSFHFLHHNHPWRKDWKKLAGVDAKNINNTSDYFNSGFIGVERGSFALIDRWVEMTDKFIAHQGNVQHFLKDTHSSIKTDQDLLNAAVTISADIEINVMGQEGMGFTLPATMMVHAIGDYKPWNKSFIKKLISSGRKPNHAEKRYFLYVKYPIRIFSAFSYRMKKLDISIASFFGRVLG